MDMEEVESVEKYTGNFEHIFFSSFFLTGLNCKKSLIHSVKIIQ